MNTIFAFLLALAILIIVHELGHFLMARWCGVKVLRFSIGFGKPLWIGRWGKDQTEWVVAAIPLGGYVKMLDEQEAQQPIAENELSRAFNRQPVLKRIAIVIAGPFANFVLALIFYFVINLIGFQAPEARVARISENNQTAHTAIPNGSLIQKINGRSVHSWNDVQSWLAEAAADRDPAVLELLTPDQRLYTVSLSTRSVVLDENQADAATQLGLHLAEQAPLFGAIVSGSPAQESDLRPGDKVLSVNNEPIDSVAQLLELIRSSATQPLDIQIMRDKQKMVRRVIPHGEKDAHGEIIGKIGASIIPQYSSILIRYNLIEAMRQAGIQLIQMGWFNLRMLGKILSGQLSLKNLSGPLTIADYAGQTAQRGWVQYINFLALISLSLGILNLFPVPLLDGGHLLYYLAEIALGRPLSIRVQEAGQRVGLALLLLLMSIALFNDITRFLHK